jgi:hypothetical protein
MSAWDCQRQALCVQTRRAVERDSVPARSQLPAQFRDWRTRSASLRPDGYQDDNVGSGALLGHGISQDGRRGDVACLATGGNPNWTTAHPGRERLQDREGINRPAMRGAQVQLIDRVWAVHPRRRDPLDRSLSDSP